MKYVHIILSTNILPQHKNCICNLCLQFQTLLSVFIVLFDFQTQLIPNPEHINHAPPALIHGLNGDLPIQETGQVFNEQLTQSQIIEVLVDNGQIEVLVITVDSTPTIVDQLY